MPRRDAFGQRFRQIIDRVARLDEAEGDRFGRLAVARWPRRMTTAAKLIDELPAMLQVGSIRRARQEKHHASARRVHQATPSTLSHSPPHGPPLLTARATDGGSAGFRQEARRSWPQCNGEGIAGLAWHPRPSFS